jgi:hypothetical protein
MNAREPHDTAKARVVGEMGVLTMDESTPI